jgi:type II secretory pathway component PulF
MIQLSVLYGVVCLLLIVWSDDKQAMAVTIAGYTALAVIALAAIFFFFSRTVPGRAIRDRIALVTPVVRSLTIKLSMARFTRTLAMQMESAIPIAEALERSARVTGNGAIAGSLRRIIKPVQQGESLVTAIKESPFVTPIIREVLTVGEETGNFGEALERVANLYEEESLTVLESLPKFIGPAVVIIVGIAVVYLFYSVYVLHYLKPLLEGAGM